MHSFKSVKVADAGKSIILQRTDGSTLRYHSTWLRDNALDSKTRDPKNRQRLITLSDIPEDAIIKWPFSKSLDDLLNYASSLGREVEEDDIDLSRYYGVTGKTASEIRDYTYFRYKKDEGVEIGATKKGRFGHTLEYGVISGSNTQKHLGWKLKDGLF